MIDNPIILNTICTITGGIATLLLQKIVDKRRYLRYSVKTNRMALSVADNIFGNIDVHWNGTQVKNLYYTVVEIENTSGKDLSDFTFNVYTGDSTMMLNDAKYIIGSSHIFDWSEEFRNAITITDKDGPTPEQKSRYYTNREYTVKVFNRGEKLPCWTS